MVDQDELSVEDREYLDVVTPSGHLRHRADGWESAITSIGTLNDKRNTYRYKAKPISFFEALEIWSGDKMCQKAIEMVPEWCFAQGYELDFGPTDEHDDLKHDVEDKIEELEVDRLVEHGFCLERGVGGSAILLGVKDNRPLSEPLVDSEVKSLDWLTLLEPIELQPYSTYTQKGHPKYGSVEKYQLSAYSPTSYGAIFGVNRDRLPPEGTTYIHESRLIIFPGRKVSRFRQANNAIDTMWGDSLITSFHEALRDFNNGMSALGLIPIDFSQSVIAIDGLTQMAAKGGESKLVARMKALMLGKSIANAVIVDTKESVTRQSVNVAGLADLVDRLAMRLGADIDVPLSLMLGLTSKTLGIDPDIEMKLHRSRIKSMQRRRVAPILKKIIGYIIRGLRQRGAPKRPKITWNSLIELTDKDQAELNLTVARTMSMIIKSGIASSDEVRKTVYNHRFNITPLFDPTKKAPGFVAPPTHGLPGSPQNPGPGGKPGAAGPGAHTVGGYARKNPVSKGTEPAPKGGGDQAPGGGSNSRKDADGPALNAYTFAGFQVVIETPKDTVREWTDRTGKSGTSTMPCDYGYITGVTGDDGDFLDVFIGPNENSEWVFVIEQNAPPDFTQYDEQKIMLGFDSPDAARQMYLSAYNEPRFFARMTMMSVDDCRQRLNAPV